MYIWYIWYISYISYISYIWYISLEITDLAVLQAGTRSQLVGQPDSVKCAAIQEVTSEIIFEQT